MNQGKKSRPSAYMKNCTVISSFSTTVPGVLH